MCGIFGYIGKNPVDPIRFRWLACENQSRGEDSSGIATPTGLYKDAVPIKELVLTHEFQDLVQGSTTIIGHTRRATMGAKIAKNAHPFEIFENPKTTDAHLVGTHNGQVFEYYLEKLCKEHEIVKPDVDSEIIFTMMSKFKFDYNEALSKIEGAMALAWLRPLEFPDVLYLYRRQSRPLHVGFIGPDMYYSSEADPLHLIGCDAIDALDTDKLYVFRKGGLLEVSPVKKSLIVTIREDQGLTTWLQTATEEEKRVLGIPGAPAKNTRTAPTHRQLHLLSGGTDTKEESTTDSSRGGWANRFPRVGGGTGALSGPLILLSQLEGQRDKYVFESLQSPGRGKFVNGGNMYAAYIVFKLLALHDKSIELPAWYVRVKKHSDISCVSAHNGIGIIEIPEKSIGSAGVTLEIVNPLQPEVIYDTVVYGVTAGRVMEVALHIPFQETQETHKTSEGEVSEGSTNVGSSIRPEESLDGVLSFPSRLADVKNTLHYLDRVCEQEESRILQERSGDGVHKINVSNSSQESSTNTGEPPEEQSFHESDALAHYMRKADVYLESSYDEKTDVLDMDAYATACNVDETFEHIKKIDTALSSIGSEEELRQTLVTLKPYMEFLHDYFQNRSAKLTTAEVYHGCS